MASGHRAVGRLGRPAADAFSHLKGSSLQTTQAIAVILKAPTVRSGATRGACRTDPSLRMEVILRPPRSWQRAIAARCVDVNITREARNVYGIAPNGKDVALPQLYGIAPKKTNGGTSPTLRYCA